MVTEQKEYNNTNNSRSFNSTIQKTKDTEQQINFSDNRSSFANIQKITNGCNIIQRFYEPQCQCIHALISFILWKPMSGTQIKKKIKEIEIESGCQANIEELGDGYFRVDFKTGRHLVYSINMIYETTDDISSEESGVRKEQIENMWKTSGRLRVIVGRGIKPICIKDVKKDVKKKKKYYFYEDRAFGMRSCNDINIDIDNELEPDIKGSIADIQTYKELIEYVKTFDITQIVEPESLPIAFMLEHVPFFEQKELDGAVQGIEYLKEYFEDIIFIDTNNIFNEQGDLVNSPKF